MLATIGALSELLQHGPWLVFVFAFGACVGSFLNVVNWRLPREMSLSHPPSRCPICGGRLRFFRENLPILGWILLRGRCRYCKAKISPIYPIVELAMALVFVVLYIVLFMVGPESTWWWEVGGPWWSRQQFGLGWPAWVAIAFLFAGLFSMTVIDARTFMIPIQIPTFVAVSAVVLWLLAAILSRPGGFGVASWPIPCTGWAASGVAFGGVIGVAVSMALLIAGIFRPSFADYEDFVPEGEVLADYPHARREMGIELLFLLPVVLGMIVGGLALAGFEGAPPRWIQAVGGSLLGWLVGGGLVWGVRILGTLGFGREAMGLGDVHLMAAVGAVLGWFDPIIIFFMAPFLGLAWTAVAAVGSRLRGGFRRELPYGPHLALAAVLVFMCRPAVNDGWRWVLPAVEMPEAGLIEPVDKSAEMRSIGQGSSQRVQCHWARGPRHQPKERQFVAERKPTHAYDHSHNVGPRGRRLWLDWLREPAGKRSTESSPTREHRTSYATGRA
ncbi:MAG: prepilin peptidase [Phycisphaerales bacterium]|nr:prepilin peptidase [Phycisphaerales bacterium]